MVKRVGNTTHQVSVDYVILPSSTATPDVDYTLASPAFSPTPSPSTPVS